MKQLVWNNPRVEQPPASRAERELLPTLDEQIAEVAAEIRLREWTHPIWVGDGRITQERMDTGLRNLHAVLRTLSRLACMAASKPGTPDDEQ